MSPPKSLTVERIISAMEKAGFATKKDVKEIIQDELAKFYVGHLKPIMATKDDLKAAKNELRDGQKTLQRQINDLKSDTVTQKEFDELKGLVDRYHGGVGA